MGRGAATPQNSMGGQPAHSRPGGARVKRPVLGAPLRPQALREVGVQRRKRCMAAAEVGAAAVAAAAAAAAAAASHDDGDDDGDDGDMGGSPP